MLDPCQLESFSGTELTVEETDADVNGGTRSFDAGARRPAAANCVCTVSGICEATVLRVSNTAGDESGAVPTARAALISETSREKEPVARMAASTSVGFKAA